MKIKKLFVLVFLVITSFFMGSVQADLLDTIILPEETPLAFSMNTIKSFLQSNQVRTPSIQSVDEELSQSNDVVFRRCLSDYIGNVYNQRDYAGKLSQDASHLVNFFELSDELNLNQTTVYVGLRLFHNKIKSCEIIDDTVLLQVLEPMGRYLEKHFQVEEPMYKTNLSFIRKHTEDILLARFTHQYAQFQAEPDKFLCNISEEITKIFKDEFSSLEKIIKDQQEKIEARERLRNMTMRFLETSLSKTMWNTQSFEGIWCSFQKIAYDLQTLAVRGIVNHMDDLDSLFWSHVHRFCYFLDLVGSHLPLEFYDEVACDLHNGMIFFLEEQEQDACIRTKKETLSEVLAQAKMRAVAFSKGIVDHFV